MDPSTSARLRAINHRFYDSLAEPFCGSRSPRQPSLQRLARRLSGSTSLLDVGCGNGRLARALHDAGLALRYTGIDSSAPLLALASANTADLAPLHVRFLLADIGEEGWEAALAGERFDAVALLAVLHHIPGWQGRADLLRTLGALLDDGGSLVISTWQFLSEPRLRRKIVSWEQGGLADGDVEAGDYLLDWRRGGYGLRYCHLVDEAELHALAAAANLEIRELTLADGPGQNLNLVAVLSQPGQRAAWHPSLSG